MFRINKETKLFLLIWFKIFTPKILVFVPDSSNAGLTEFEDLVITIRNGRFRAKIVGVVSEPNSDIKQVADRLGITFRPFKPVCHRWTELGFRVIAQDHPADFYILFGYTGPTEGLRKSRTLKIQKPFVKVRSLRDIVKRIV